VKLELDIARMRRDLAEKDNIIEEKAERNIMSSGISFQQEYQVLSYDYKYFFYLIG
jgi:hypothetical protein